MSRMCTAALAAATAIAVPSALSADAVTVQQLKVIEHNVDQAFLLHYLHKHKEKVHAAPGKVRGIGVRIVKATRNSFSHKSHLHVVEMPDVNAITSPGGNIFLYKGLIGNKLTDDEIAALLGHEIAHMVHWHWLARLKRNIDAARLAQYAAQRYGRSSAQISYLLQAMQNLQYDRQEEFQADMTGMQLMVEAGFKPEGAVTLLKKVQALKSPETAAAETNPYLATHPAMEERIARLQAHIASGQTKPLSKRLVPLRRQ